MTEHHLKVQRTARYYSSNVITAQTKQVWLVIHGFGQQAALFIQNFEFAFSSERVFVAPEALNRFYLKGSHGQVGATWMTKEDRLNEIADYIAYLDDLYDAVVGARADLKITVLGFSQGASTATRWVHATSKRIDRVIVYAGEVAPELVPLSASSGLRKTENHFIYGTADEFFPVQLMRDAQVHYSSLQFKVTEFEGGHIIQPDTLQQFLS